MDFPAWSAALVTEVGAAILAAAVAGLLLLFLVAALMLARSSRRRLKSGSPAEPRRADRRDPWREAARRLRPPYE